jgi:hypothetical protein
VIDPFGEIGNNLIKINVESVADFQWHFKCFDLSIGIRNTSYSSYPSANLRIYQVYQIL